MSKKKDLITEIITALYSPANNIQSANATLPGYEIVEAITEHITIDPKDRKEIFSAMRDLGFKSVNIENTLYWLVMYN
jgi:hypothetical protein